MADNSTLPKIISKKENDYGNIELKIRFEKKTYFYILDSRPWVWSILKKKVFTKRDWIRIQNGALRLLAVEYK